MKVFLISLALCSVVMSLVSLLYLLLERALKNVWSGRARVFVWWLLTVGFLTPVKPHLPAAVYTVNAGPAQASAVGMEDPGPVFPLQAIFLLWLCGAVVTAAYYLLRQYRFRSYVRRFAVQGGAQACRIAAEASSALRTATPRVLYLAGIDSPMLTGLVHPVVLLPVRTFGAEELRLVFKHELTHFRRRDLWLRLAFLCSRTAHWFNPVLILFGKRLNAVCEIACDEAVTQGESFAAKKAYCGAILSAAERSSARMPVLASSLGCTKKQLKDRLRMILHAGSRKSLIALCIALAVVVAFSGAAFAVRTENRNTNAEITTTALGTEISGADGTFYLQTTAPVPWDGTYYTQTTAPTPWEAYAFDPYSEGETVTRKNAGEAIEETTTAIIPWGEVGG